jgi:hypothetical protein
MLRLAVRRSSPVVLALFAATACSGGGGKSPSPPPRGTGGSADSTGGAGGTGAPAGGTGPGTTGGSTGSPAAGSDGGADAPVTAGTPDAAPRPISLDAGAQSPVLPVVIIDLPGKMPTDLMLGAPKIEGRIRIIEDHNGMFASVADLMTRPTTLDSPAGISLHGNSSSQYPQKSYSIEFHDKAGVSVNAPALGMPDDSDWDLISCWVDKPCMRDSLAYTMGQYLGRWSPRIRFVEVYFNTQYIGLYQWVESPRRGKNRVAIPKIDDPGSNDTGGYIFRREGWGKGGPTDALLQDWLSPTKGPDRYGNQILYTYHYPRPENITPAQKTYLQKYVADFETMMKGATWNDPTTGYPAKLDVQSWIDYALVNEITMNVDGYYKSVYYAKWPDSAGGKLAIWPIWDYNLSFGNADTRSAWRSDILSVEAQRLGDTMMPGGGGQCAYYGHAWIAPAAPSCDTGCCTPACNPATARCWTMPNIPFYWDKLWADPAFQNQMKCRWQELRKGPFSMAFIDARLTEWTMQVKPLAIPRHYKQWPQLLALQPENPYVKDPSTAPPPGATPVQFFDHEMSWMRAWIEKRLTFLDQKLPGTCAP